jgi:hypothetical protein
MEKVKKTVEVGKSATAVANCIINLEAFKEFEQKLIELANTIEFVDLKVEVDTYQAVKDNPTFSTEKKVLINFAGGVIEAGYNSVAIVHEHPYEYPYEIRKRFCELNGTFEKFATENFSKVPTRNCKLGSVLPTFQKLAKVRIEKLMFGTESGIIFLKLKEMTKKIFEIESAKDFETDVRESHKLDAFERIKNIAITYNLTDEELAEAMNYVVVHRVVKS